MFNSLNPNGRPCRIGESEGADSSVATCSGNLSIIRIDLERKKIISSGSGEFTGEVWHAGAAISIGGSGIDHWNEYVGIGSLGPAAYIESSQTMATISRGF